MKTFIVFVALIMVFTCLCVYTDDIARYKQINIALKALAEEIACGGGLMTGDTDLTENLQINQLDAQSYADFMISQASNWPIFSSGKLTCSVDASGVTTNVVIVTYEPTSTPIFHLLDIGPKTVVRKSTYEWLLLENNVNLVD